MEEKKLNQNYYRERILLNICRKELILVMSMKTDTSKMGKDRRNICSRNHVQSGFYCVHTGLPSKIWKKKNKVPAEKKKYNKSEQK